jgi:hypothetical protein
VQLTFSEEIEGTECPFTITRTWTATDLCGNSASTSQVLTVTDTEAPYFENLEPEVYVNCGELWSYMIEATDNCDDNVEITFEDEFFSGGCFGVRQRTWTATDNCGNTSSATQFIRQIDETLPELFNIPDDVTVDCDMDIPEISTDIYAIDNCDDDVEITFVEEVTSEFCPFTISRTWIATDECGNVSQGTQVITVELETPEQVEIFSYPNPFNDSFTVNFSVPKNEQVKALVVDGMGRTLSVVFDGQADGHRLYEYTFSGLDWEPGSYTLMMIVGNEVHHHKLMVQQR